MDSEEDKLRKNLISIASELYRFRNMFERLLSRVEPRDQEKYMSQFQWFNKKVSKALEDSDISLIDLKGQLYNEGMAVSALNIDDFEAQDKLFVAQSIEPVIMLKGELYRPGTVILGRIEK